MYTSLHTSPTSWNSLPDHFRDPTLSSDSFTGKLITTESLVIIKQLSAVEMLANSALHKFSSDIDTRTPPLSPVIFMQN